MDTVQHQVASMAMLENLLQEMEELHAAYMERYAELHQRQLALLKNVSARADAAKATRLAAQLSADQT